MSAGPVVVWFRDDLRLADHPALQAAVARKAPVLCVYIFDEESPGLRLLGGASRWWLHHSLARLGESLEAIGGRLDLFAGAAQPLLAALLRETGATMLVFNRRYERAEQAIDDAITREARTAGVGAESFVGTVLHEPNEVVPKTGGYYKIFSAYWRAANAIGFKHPPVPAPKMLTAAPAPAGTVALDDLKLMPSIAWDAGLRDTWVPGEAQASKALDAFVSDVLETYPESRNRIGIDGSSRLSPHLRFGEVSPAQVFAAVDVRKGNAQSAEKLKAEVGWRDFNRELLWNYPDLPNKPFHPAFEAFPTERLPPATLKAWKRGRTGYPIVDAGMRQLWNTGFMHNRVRMIAASFLVKHLLADWRLGEQWFWDTLCDADPANNPVNWQWVAGCGNDPVPYFRIFNPVLQGEKFDPDGAYVRRWVPELAGVPDRFVHSPWDAPKSVLAESGVVLGKTYPTPIVDHKAARARALAALATYRDLLSTPSS